MSFIIDMVSYNIETINKIQEKGFTYTLPEEVKNNIKKLVDDLGILIITSNTLINNKQGDYCNRFDRDRGESSRYKKPRFDARNKFVSANAEQVWEKQKAFIATKIEKKEGIEKLINDIRICLNKISTKNYDSQKDSIIQYIDQIIENEEDVNDLNIIAISIFDTASTNKFYSELYATLYNELTIKYPIFKVIINEFIDKYLESINKISYIESEVDYDKYCNNNKDNDKRRATTVFMVNLMKKNLFDKTSVLNIVIKLQDLVLSFIDQEKKLNEVDEITENIFLFISSSDKEFINEEIWNAVVNNIKECSQLKVKEHLSISSRSIFKYKDIVDLIKKLN